MQGSLSTRIFVGLFVGLVIGSVIQYLFADITFLNNNIVGVAEGLGGMFVSLIKLMVVPLVYISIVTGICELRDIASFGRLGSKTFGLYIVNTMLSIAAAILVGQIFKPGMGASLPNGASKTVELATTETPDIGALLINIVPSNPVQAFASGDMLQIIFMAIITGLAIQAMGSGGAPAMRTFRVANQVMMKLVGLVMTLAPYGVFALMISLGATLEANTLMSVAGYVGLVVLVLAFWILVVYPLAVWMFTGIRPKVFRQATREQLLFSLSTASSNATIPVTMRTLTDKLGVSRAIAGFGVPLGATINMSGSAIYITLAAMFAANISGTPIPTGDLLTVGFTVLLMSVGVGGVPGGAVVMAGVLLLQMGLPIEAMAIIMAVDRINDMFCTSSNVVGDTAVNTIVAKMEGNPDPVNEGDLPLTSAKEEVNS
ncbi:dicarboxylate/amino acid:cation symporter [Oceanisphaera pacifica]|uniref:Dicarboxylate/amino acid:cation symporter n=1 Tax=Oceanisphaera pacifica TaxID=2818389 RepID=A0ABS3NHT6_9GAMM|nr:dicarboxylate/amino acid:cation symporter [Oceanisphaera pacifica]MBO1520148.1 dicarboxylate/amino acid:cation symporter [Oceanisphaera pacifica]